MKLNGAIESQFKKAIRLLRGGGLVIAPTETFYGILGDAWSQKAVKRLVEIKERDFGKPIPLIAGDIITVSKCVTQIPPIFKPLADRFWPGPLTLVMKAVQGFPDGVTAGSGSIGIRIPGTSPALDLARFYRGPLTATSANFMDQMPARHVSELDETLINEVDLVIDGGWSHGTQPSTVLNLTLEQPEVLRYGVLGEEVEMFLTTGFS